MRVQKINPSIDAPNSSKADWAWLNQISSVLGGDLLPETVTSDRELFFEMASDSNLFSKELTLSGIGKEGKSIDENQDVNSDMKSGADA